MSAAGQQQGGAEGQPRQTLTLFDAVAMIVGLIVGAGIFGTPSIVAGAVESKGLLVAVWVAGAFGNHVMWRGHRLRLTPDGRISQEK